MESRGVRSQRRVDIDHRLLCIAIPGDDTSIDALRYATQHPRSSSSLGMTRQVLLSDDRDGVSRRSRDVLEDIIVQTHFILFVGYCAGSVDRNDTCGAFSKVQITRSSNSPMSSGVRPQTPNARRRGAMRGSVPSSIPKVPRASFSC